MSSAPTTRSSVAPSGRSMTGVGLDTMVRSSTCAQSGISASDAAFTGQPATASIEGKRAANARTAVDFPVPRSPNTKTPPMPGSIAVRTMACFISSWPTIAENGKTRVMLRPQNAGEASALPMCPRHPKHGSGRIVLRKTIPHRGRPEWPRSGVRPGGRSWPLRLCRARSKR